MAPISRSAWSKALATATAVLAFASLFAITILDSRDADSQALGDQAAHPLWGARLAFNATAYCKGATTTAGVPVRAGVAAADPRLLPVGSVVQLDTTAGPYRGIYTVMDTGPRLHGRELDIYMWSCNEALKFGRRRVRLAVLRHGWNPQTAIGAPMQKPHS